MLDGTESLRIKAEGVRVRVLHVVPLIGANGEYGGPSGGTMRQAKHLASRGHEVTVLSLWAGQMPGDRSDEVTVQAFKARRLPGFPGFAGLMSLKALWWVLRNGSKYEIVHIHVGRELWVVLTMHVLRMRRTPYVLQTHGMLAPRRALATRIYDALLVSKAVAAARMVMYLTGYERKDLIALKWPRRLELVLNGVDGIDDAPPSGIDDRECRVVTTGRLHPRKSIPDLVDAVVRARADGTPISLKIFGPEEGDGARIRKHIEDGSAASYVEVPGALPYAQIRAELRSANIFVLPSRAEPFPNSLLEALASGLPSVCTTECGVAPYIEQSAAGIVVDPGAEQIYEALSVLAADPALRASLAENALQLCRDTFSMEAVALRLESLYADALAGEPIRTAEQ